MINLYNYHNNPEQLYQYSLYANPLKYVGASNEYDRKELYDPVLHIIKQKAIWAHWYAYTVIKGRWEEAEPVIMNDPGYAYYYAMYTIKGRWLEAEPYIKENRFYWSEYSGKFL